MSIFQIEKSMINAPYNDISVICFLQMKTNIKGSKTTQ